jgi:hypothetical protein
VVSNVRYWHLTDKPPAPEFVAYWTNNGQKAALGLDLSAAIDPKRNWSVRRSTHAAPVKAESSSSIVVHAIPERRPSDINKTYFLADAKTPY